MEWAQRKPVPRAYPRSRGATCGLQLLPQLVQGLSPLARGNLQELQRGRSGGGPIPARAGQPGDLPGAGQPQGAYPRSRGATCNSLYDTAFGRGLSPLARGNQVMPTQAAVPHGPIPARAGQPGGRRARGHDFRAYPRSRGATDDGHHRGGARDGLSPLARGNHSRDENTERFGGPIPARAGQPWTWAAPTPAAWAYPRSRGAT